MLALYVREALASASELPTVLEAVEVEASSVIAPVWSLPALGASLAPVTVIVTVIVSEAVPSDTVIVNVSVGASPASRAVVADALLSSV